jgi:ribosomal protein S18 acetylase RimI-like enzyme
MISIRKASGSDAETLAQLNAEFNGVEADSERFRNAILSDTGHETILVAESANQIVGFLSLQRIISASYPAPTFEVAELYVQPKHRKSGVGTALLGHAVVLAPPQDGVEILIRTGATNEAARSLFARVGYEQTAQVVYRLRPHAA